jgi:hypothetical protein
MHMANTTVTIPASDFTKHVTLHVRVTGLAVWNVRWRVARQLLLLAARVAGCGITVDVVPREG